MVEAMDLHIAAYGMDEMVPKWHAQLHLVSDITSRGKAWGTFTLERRHKLFKMFATPVTNTACFERTVVASLLNHQLDTMNDPGRKIFASGSFLKGPEAEADGAVLGIEGSVLISKHASCNM